MIHVAHEPQSAQTYSCSSTLKAPFGALLLLSIWVWTLLAVLSSSAAGLSVVGATMSSTDVYEW